MFLFSSHIQKARKLVAASRRPLILTGAGLSLASGIPTFRGSANALWKNPELLKYAFAETFATDPDGMWRAHEDMRALVDSHESNIGHRAIHAMGTGRDVEIFTQNVDGYHARVGDRAKELHGTLHAMRCCTCPYRVSNEVGIPAPHSCPQCGNWLRHDVVWFGEDVRFMAEFALAARSADLVLLIGTSGLVTDTALIAREARARNVPVIEINPALCTPATRWSTVSLRGPAERVLPDLVAE